MVLATEDAATNIILKTKCMKNLIIVLGLILVVSINSCKEVDKLTHFNMDYNSSVTIPSTIGINLPFDIYSPDIKTNSTETFEVNNTNKDLVEEAQLTDLSMTITSPTGNDFSFLKSIEIYLSADGLDEIKVAWNDQINGENKNTISLETSSENLEEYIKKDEIKLKVTTVTDEVILRDYDIDINSNFYIDAKILGI